jgi:hypothetical protein
MERGGIWIIACELPLAILMIIPQPKNQTYSKIAGSSVYKTWRIIWLTVCWVCI